TRAPARRCCARSRWPLRLKGRHWVAVWLVAFLAVTWLVYARQTAAIHDARELIEIRARRASLEGHKAELERRVRTGQSRAAQVHRTERIVLPARRGTLSDRHGTPLALTQETYHVGVAPNELRDPARDGALIARQLGLTGRWQEALHKRYAYLAGPFSALEV